MKDKKLKRYFVLLALLLIALIYVEANRKEPLDWTPTFINSDKNPYGTYICFDLLKDVFPNKDIPASRYPITNELNYIDEQGNDYLSEDIKHQNTSYIFINKNFGTNYTIKTTVDKLDVENLLSFVEEGNNAFIAAESMTPFLLDTLRLKIGSNWGASDTTYVFNNVPPKEYSFKGINSGQFYIEKQDSCLLDIEVLAESKKLHKTIFAKIKHGDGYIYLHTMPVVFSNVELLNLHKYDFAFTCLSYLPKSNSVIWDEYLKQGRIGEGNSFRVIWNHPALLIAYYIALLGGLMFILFRSKRTQRIIPVVKPPKNASLEFLDTISNLYHQKEAYESIVEKRYNYFLDIIRTRYYLSTEKIDDEFMEKLSLKSGVDINVIKGVFDLHKEIENSHDVSNHLLLQYNEKLEKFYRKIK